MTVIFPLACVCLASCKRHVVQVGREYLLEPSPCARSTPAMASKRLKLKAVNDCRERRSFAQRFMVMKENLKDHSNWKKCFFCQKSQAATCCNMLHSLWPYHFSVSVYPRDSFRNMKSGWTFLGDVFWKSFHGGTQQAASRFIREKNNNEQRRTENHSETNHASCRTATCVAN